MKSKRRIVGLEVIAPGSNPDVDSDFHTQTRDAIKKHVADLYGADKTANIITFNTAAAKGAFKNMCTIYGINFAQAQKVSDTIPEAPGCTLNDLFDPSSDFYSAGADFRAATSGPEWQELVAGARRLAGRVRGTGQHACGVIISGKSLRHTVPLTLGKKDKQPMTQWVYPECENMGLIKFDFLGLDTVDLVQLTTEYIMKNRGVAPDMVALVQGPMDDKETFELFARGDTAGIFQFHTDLATGYSKLLKPERFEHLAASTALCRPGPMSLQSHVRFAMRKNGEEETRPIHPEFVGTALDEILGETYQLVVFQEQIQLIANRIAGMSLAKADKIRKAAGKKQRDLMESLGDEFKEGGVKEGFSLEAMETLWDAIEGFAEYGFNKSHSVAYAMNSYQCAWLKAHYPVEFMAALISQAVGNKDKVRNYIQDARSMGIKMGPIDINSSTVRVAPDYTKKSGYDIVFGIAGAASVSEETAQTIVDERDAHGPFASVQDLIDRCVPLGITTKKAYENLALAGAFDCFGVKRRAVVESLDILMKEAKTKKTKGESLFDMFEAMEGEESGLEETVDLTAGEEYSHVDKLQREANITSLFITGHPLENLGVGLSSGGVTTLSKLLQSTSTTTASIVAAVTHVDVQVKRSKSILVVLDDGKKIMSARLSRELVKGLERKEAQGRIEAAYLKGAIEISEDIVSTALATEFTPRDPIAVNGVYILNVTLRPGYGNKETALRVNSFAPLMLGPKGELPIRLRKEIKDAKAASKTAQALLRSARDLSEKVPGKYPIYTSVFTPEALLTPEDRAAYYMQLVRSIRARKEISPEANLPLEEGLSLRSFTEGELAEAVEYTFTGCYADKKPEVEERLTRGLGAERVDFGVFNSTIF